MLLLWLCLIQFFSIAGLRTIRPCILLLINFNITFLRA